MGLHGYVLDDSPHSIHDAPSLDCYGDVNHAYDDANHDFYDANYHDDCGEDHTFTFKSTEEESTCYMVMHADELFHNGKIRPLIQLSISDRPNDRILYAFDRPGNCYLDYCTSNGRLNHLESIDNCCIGHSKYHRINDNHSINHSLHYHGVKPDGDIYHSSTHRGIIVNHGINHSEKHRVCGNEGNKYPIYNDISMNEGNDCSSYCGTTRGNNNVHSKYCLNCNHSNDNNDYNKHSQGFSAKHNLDCSKYNGCKKSQHNPDCNMNGAYCSFKDQDNEIIGASDDSSETIANYGGINSDKDVIYYGIKSGPNDTRVYKELRSNSRTCVSQGARPTTLLGMKGMNPKRSALQDFLGANPFLVIKKRDKFIRNVIKAKNGESLTKPSNVTKGRTSSIEWRFPLKDHNKKKQSNNKLSPQDPMEKKKAFLPYKHGLFACLYH